jgi:hypothetical protein
VLGGGAHLGAIQIGMLQALAQHDLSSVPLRAGSAPGGAPDVGTGHAEGDEEA